MRCLAILSALALLFPDPGYSQMPELRSSTATPSAVTRAAVCNYEQCALRLRFGYLNSHVVQGANNRKVGTLGAFSATDVSPLMKSVPEAAGEAQHSRRSYAVARSIIWSGALIGAAGIGLTSASHGNSLGIATVATGLIVSSYGAWRQHLSLNQLRHSISLYNRSLR
jgi:hypothetical protein